MSKQELQEKLKSLASAIDGIIAKADAEKRPLNEDEQAEIAKLEGEYDQLFSALKAEDASEAIRTKQADRKKALTESAGRKVQPGRVTNDDEGRKASESYFEMADDEPELTFVESEDAQRRLSYREQKRANTRLLKRSGYKPWGEFGSFAEFVQDGFERHQSHAFQDRCRKHYAAVSGMSEGVASDGGYLVMPEFASGIVDRVYGNSLWSRTDNYTVSGNNLTFLCNAETSRATGSRHGGMRGYWLSEGATITSSKPTLREVTLKLVKLGVVVYLTQELIDDGGAALQQYVARKAAEEFEFMIGDALVNGTGVGQPLGMLAFPSLVSVAKETGQLAATLAVENITKMYSRFYAPNLPGAVWLHNQDIFPQLATMTLGIGTAGVAVYMPPGGVASAPNASLMGKSMLATEFNATLGTQGDLILADMGQILSISKGGIAQAASIHVQFLTDQLALRFVMRLNAGPWESAPITPYKGGSNTQSSFVTLDARS